MRAPVILAAVALPFGCTTFEEGIVVELKTRSALGESSTHTPLFFQSGATFVDIEHLHVVVSEIELIECTDTTTALLHIIAIPSAEAHSTTTPLRLGVPHVIDVSSTSSTSNLVGRLRPPPGSYCSVRLSFGPADSDTLGLSTSSALFNRTITVEGRKNGVPFSFTTGATYSVEATLTDEAGIERPLVLSSENRRASLTYAMNLVDWPHLADEATTSEVGARAILLAIGRTVRAMVGP
jgi:hypothetical protein